MGRWNSHSLAGKTAALFGGIGIGAALMYVLDPERGRRRRAMARERAVSIANKTGRTIGATSRDLNNRARGAASELRSAFARPGRGGTLHGDGGDKESGAPQSGPAGAGMSDGSKGTGKTRPVGELG
jgi:hypothetical protein